MHRLLSSKFARSIAPLALPCLVAALILEISKFSWPPPASAQMAPIISPEVSSDHRVTFRLLAPAATQVAVNLEGNAEPIPMKKDEHGLWSVTTGPLEPDFYSYTFRIDGKFPLADPANTHITPNLLFVSTQLHVPGPSSLPWEVGDGPHGVIHHHFYHSNIIGDDRDYYVYTPPDYDLFTKSPYPVLYLLHGFSDDASGWTAVGRANFILDHLINEKKVRPMVVVMPLGYGVPSMVRHGFQAFDHPDLIQENLDKYREALLAEVMPAIESEYHVSKDRKDRAIAGLSMGGSESLYVGLNALDKFSYIGAFSEGGLPDDFAKDFPSLDATAAAKLKVLWMSCGKDDRLLSDDQKARDYLESKGIKVEWVETPGRHQWQVWRRNLINLAPKLFQ
ncbi:MAG TPA: alpha/beta hydrolase-fold protein [Candidatus Acidoferrales bacterium]|nr:alpha/beta hydrolase-fold protein [Candidatus Acidoferrales bacterium]